MHTSGNMAKKQCFHNKFLKLRIIHEKRPFLQPYLFAVEARAGLFHYGLQRFQLSLGTVKDTL